MKNLENSFKEALVDFDEISPSKALWTRISTSLLLKSAGFKVALFSVLAFLLVGLPSYFLYSTSNSIAETNSLQDKAQTSNDFSKKSRTLTANTIHKQVSESSQETEKTHSKESITTKQANKHTDKSSISTSSSDKSINQTHNIQTSSSQTKLQNNYAETSKQTLATSTKQHTDNTNSLSSFPTKPTAANAKVIPVNITSGGQSNSSIEVNSQRQSIQELSPSTVAQEERKSIKKSQEIVKISPLSDLVDFNEISITPKDFSYQKYFPYQIAFRNEVEIFAGPNIAFNQLTSKDNSLQSTIDLRTSNESPKLSYHFGLNYRTYYKKWVAGIGVNYYRIEDRASYLMPSVDVDSSISSYMIFNTTYNRVIIGYLQNPNDTTSQIPIYKVTATQDTSLVNEVHYDSTQSMKSISFTNTYSYIEVPIMLGREFRFKYFVFDISGGVSWNRLIKTQVSIPNADGTALISGSELDNILVKNTFNAIFALGIAYQVNEGSLIFVRPTMRYNMNSLFEKSYPIDQKYLQIRLSIGMRIKL